jgi:hypothetical protein
LLIQAGIIFAICQAQIQKSLQTPDRLAQQVFRQDSQLHQWLPSSNFVKEAGIANGRLCGSKGIVN